MQMLHKRMAYVGGGGTRVECEFQPSWGPNIGVGAGGVGSVHDVLSWAIPRLARRRIAASAR